MRFLILGRSVRKEKQKKKNKNKIGKGGPVLQHNIRGDWKQKRCGYNVNMAAMDEEKIEVVKIKREQGKRMNQQNCTLICQHR